MGGEIIRLIGFIIITIGVLACTFLTNRRKKSAVAWILGALILPLTGFAIIIMG